MNKIGQLLGLFLKLGVTAFGGPAAHIAMMEDEVVTRRGWMTRERFLDLIGATNLIPGPNSTEMAIHIGFVRAGIVGLVVAGVSFILPAALLTLGCAWVYDRFQTVPQAEALLYGIKPAVIAVILSAVWRLGKTAAKGPFLIGIGFLVMVLVLFGINEIIALLGGGIVGILWQLGSRLGKGKMLLGFVWLPSSNLALSITAAPPSSVTLSSLGLFFLKIGCVLFGSGYVLIAFLQGGLVEQHQWLTQQQLLDAVAIGQFTPGARPHDSHIHRLRFSRTSWSACGDPWHLWTIISICISDQPTHSTPAPVSGCRCVSGCGQRKRDWVNGGGHS